MHISQSKMTAQQKIPRKRIALREKKKKKFNVEKIKKASPHVGMVNERVYVVSLYLEKKKTGHGHGCGFENKTSRVKIFLMWPAADMSAVSLPAAPRGAHNALLWEAFYTR